MVLLWFKMAGLRIPKHLIQTNSVSSSRTRRWFFFLRREKKSRGEKPMNSDSPPWIISILQNTHFFRKDHLTLNIFPPTESLLNPESPANQAAVPVPSWPESWGMWPLHTPPPGCRREVGSRGHLPARRQHGVSGEKLGKEKVNAMCFHTQLISLGLIRGTPQCSRNGTQAPCPQLTQEFVQSQKWQSG